MSTGLLRKEVSVGCQQRTMLKHDFPLPDTRLGMFLPPAPSCPLEYPHARFIQQLDRLLFFSLILAGRSLGSIMHIRILSRG